MMLSELAQAKVKILRISRIAFTELTIVVAYYIFGDDGDDIMIGGDNIGETFAEKCFC